MTMGERIYTRRKALGYTMDELGKKCGVDRSTVNKWEKGVVENMKQSMIMKLSTALECSPIWLCGWSDDLTEDQGRKDASLLLKIKQLTPQNRAIVESTIDAMLNNQ